MLFRSTYSADTIAKMAQKYFVSGAVNTTSINHNGETLDGVSLVQWYIKDTDKGIVPNGFDDVKDGSLFAEFHIENENLWTACKDGTFKGFSLEGYFTTEKTNLKSDKMENKILQKVRELLVKLAKVTTDKGELSYEGDLEVGTEVVDADGVAVPDGDYTLEGGKIIVIKDGKVETIEESVELEEEEVPAEEPTVPKADFDALKADFDALKAVVDELKSKVDELKKPVEEPIESKFSRMSAGKIETLQQKLKGLK